MIKNFMATSLFFIISGFIYSAEATFKFPAGSETAETRTITQLNESFIGTKDINGVSYAQFRGEVNSIPSPSQKISVTALLKETDYNTLKQHFIDFSLNNPHLTDSFLMKFYVVGTRGIEISETFPSETGRPDRSNITTKYNYDHQFMPLSGNLSPIRVKLEMNG